MFCVEPRSDLAVLRMENATGLPTATIGSSSRMRPGDFVVALGSPLNLTNSVTCGIVANGVQEQSRLFARTSGPAAPRARHSAKQMRQRSMSVATCL